MEDAVKPRLLDLFCGAGGAAMGYSRAGFDVVGVDIAPQPNYPFGFHQADVFDFLDGVATEIWFDAIHASPPCLIAATRERLIASGLPYVIENVVGARKHMVNPITLHGGMFDLGVHRPRLFESNIAMLQPTAEPVDDPIGVYGKSHDGRLLFKRSDGTEQHAASSLEQAGEAMGIDWMAWRELAEAIPPAYTEWIGARLLESMGAAA